MSNELEAAEAIRNLHGFELHGLPLRVKESVSKVRQVAGMGNPDQCYRSACLDVCKYFYCEYETNFFLGGQGVFSCQRWIATHKGSYIHYT